jgi:hypothetical protein
MGKKDILPGFAQRIRDGGRLMISSRGYFGWARERGMVGDSPFLMKGCSVPVVLKPRPGGGFYLVGDAFVHGLMSGQGIKGVSDDSW